MVRFFVILTLSLCIFSKTLFECGDSVGLFFIFSSFLSGEVSQGLWPPQELTED